MSLLTHDRADLVRQTKDRDDDSDSAKLTALMHAVRQRDQETQATIKRALADIAELQAGGGGADRLASRLTDLEQKIASRLPVTSFSQGPLLDLRKADGLIAVRKGAGSARDDWPDVSLSGLRRKAFVNQGSDPTAGFPVLPQQSIVPVLRPPRFYASLVPTPTTSDTIQLVDMTPAGTAAKQVKQGDVKAEITNAAAIRNIPIDTVAAHKTVSQQLLDDVAALEAFLRAEMLGLVEDAVDASVVTSLTAAATPYAPAAGANGIDTVITAVGTLYGKGGGSVVVGLSIQDWIAMSLIKDDQGRYQLSPLSLLTSMAGATLVPVSSIPAGSFLACSTPAGAYFAERMGFSIRWSTEHSDNFVRNLATILAETRCAGVPQDPRLILAGDLVPAA